MCTLTNRLVEKLPKKVRFAYCKAFVNTLHKTFGIKSQVRKIHRYNR